MPRARRSRYEGPEPRIAPRSGVLCRAWCVSLCVLVPWAVATLGAADRPARLIDAIKSGNRSAVRTLLKQPSEIGVRAAVSYQMLRPHLGLVLHFVRHKGDFGTFLAADDRCQRAPGRLTAGRAESVRVKDGNDPFAQRDQANHRMNG